MHNNNVIEIAGKRLITLNTFAREFGFHIRTAQVWAKQYDMPIIRIGNQMLLELDDIPAWLARHKNERVL